VDKEVELLMMGRMTWFSNKDRDYLITCGIKK